MEANNETVTLSNNEITVDNIVNMVDDYREHVRVMKLSTGEDIIGLMYEYEHEFMSYPMVDPFLIATMTNPRTNQLNVMMMDFCPFSDNKYAMVREQNIVAIQMPFSELIELWEKAKVIRDTYVHPNNKAVVSSGIVDMTSIIEHIRDDELKKKATAENNGEKVENTETNKETSEVPNNIISIFQKMDGNNSPRN